MIILGYCRLDSEILLTADDTWNKLTHFIALLCLDRRMYPWTGKLQSILCQAQGYWQFIIIFVARFFRLSCLVFIALSINFLGHISCIQGDATKNRNTKTVISLKQCMNFKWKFPIIEAVILHNGISFIKFHYCIQKRYKLWFETMLLFKLTYHCALVIGQSLICKC